MAAVSYGRVPRAEGSDATLVKPPSRHARSRLTEVPSWNFDIQFENAVVGIRTETLKVRQGVSDCHRLRQSGQDGGRLSVKQSNEIIGGRR